jgi:hypothetical protein
VPLDRRRSPLDRRRSPLDRRRSPLDRRRSPLDRRRSPLTVQRRSHRLRARAPSAQRCPSRAKGAYLSRLRGIPLARSARSLERRYPRLGRKGASPDCSGVSRTRSRERLRPRDGPLERSDRCLGLRDAPLGPSRASLELYKCAARAEGRVSRTQLRSPPPQRRASASEAAHKRARNHRRARPRLAHPRA